MDNVVHHVDFRNKRKLPFDQTLENKRKLPFDQTLDFVPADGSYTVHLVEGQHQFSSQDGMSAKQVHHYASVILRGLYHKYQQHYPELVITMHVDGEYVYQLRSRQHPTRATTLARLTTIPND